jgi:mRNA interferase RelE/StbE
MAVVWRVEFDRDAARDLKKLGAAAQRTVLQYLRERIATAEDPRRFGHALTGDLKGLWRYRVGDFRIVASIEDEKFIVLVVTIGHRREVYR